MVNLWLSNVIDTFCIAPKDLQKKKIATDKQDLSEKHLQAWKPGSTFDYTNIIVATQDVEGLTYQLWTTETSQVYKLIVSPMHNSLSD